MGTILSGTNFELYHDYNSLMNSLCRLMGKSDPKIWVKTTATQITHCKGNSNPKNTFAKQPPKQLVDIPPEWIAMTTK